jgi:hypothetical protein
MQLRVPKMKNGGRGAQALKVILKSFSINER